MGFSNRWLLNHDTHSRGLCRDKAVGTNKSQYN
jgi:hypothetical protein